MSTDAMKTKVLFDLTHTAARELLEQVEFPWDALPEIGAFILKLGATLSLEEYDLREEGVWVAKSAVLYPNVTIAAPAIIGSKTEVRPGAFLRGNTLVGANCVVGNSTELKNVILFDNVQVPHYNYVGDSILGFRSHMGAAAVTSNVKQDKTPVSVRYAGGKVDTGLKKFGAMLGDGVEIGCGSVLNPGTVVGKNARVYPLSMVRGLVHEAHIYKNTGEMVPIQAEI